MAGHLIECSSYVCGGYYSGFKDLFDGCENIGFPIAEIYADGTCTIEKEPGTGGEISIGTVASQLLYEIQGPLYYGSDVVANLEGIQMVQDGKDRVVFSGAKGLPPPTTTKVGVTAWGGYQAEFHYYLCGIDLESKAEWTKKQYDRSLFLVIFIACFEASTNYRILSQGPAQHGRECEEVRRTKVHAERLLPAGPREPRSCDCRFPSIRADQGKVTCREGYYRGSRVQQVVS